MNESDARTLLERLLRADSEDEVIGALREAGYWDDVKAWRDYGDEDDNFSTFSNQSSRAEYALIEKITNSIDAVLIGECMRRGIDPKGPRAPKSLRRALAEFFDKPSKGYLVEWPKTLRQSVSKRITISLTGATAGSAERRSPCITIVDDGEGQTPETLTETILSIHRGNKKNIPFVQGEYNQGGTGALEFCGKNHLQLVLTKRDPAIENNDSDQRWGFTVVRRERPRENERNFRYTYLAPVQRDEEKNGVLTFDADGLAIFPTGAGPYERHTDHGTLIKLYEYRYQKTGMALGKGGLLYRLRLLLPEAPLPFTLFDHRFEKKNNYQPVAGLATLLEENPENIEERYHLSFNVPLNESEYEKFSAIVFVFKADKYKNYKGTEGVLYSYNGQVHGHLDDRVFRNPKKVGLDFIAKDLLVILDCSEISATAKAELLMSSRDRVRESDFAIEVRDRLFSELKSHEGLRHLRNRRQEEAAKRRISDTRPIEEILQKMIKRSEALSSLFALGDSQKLTSAFKSMDVGTERIVQQTCQFPTYFRFKKKPNEHLLVKDAYIGENFRVFFETDADEDYFHRRNEPGELKLEIRSNDGDFHTYGNFTGPHTYNGIVTLNIQLPYGAAWGDELHFVVTVSDVTLNNFRNELKVNVLPARDVGGQSGARVKPPGSHKGKDRKVPQTLAPPRPIEVHQDEWSHHDFDKFSALRVSFRDSDSDGEQIDFFVNMDNEFFLHELKGLKETSAKHQIAKFQYLYGNVLIGMALIRQFRGDEKGNSDDDVNDENLFEYVQFVTRATAPFLVPMFRELGSIDLSEIELEDEMGPSDDE